MTRAQYNVHNIPPKASHWLKVLDKYKCFLKVTLQITFNSLSLGSLVISAITSVPELLRCLCFYYRLLICSWKFCSTVLPECLEGILKLNISKCLTSQSSQSVVSLTVPISDRSTNIFLVIKAQNFSAIFGFVFPSHIYYQLLDLVGLACNIL